INADGTLSLPSVRWTGATSDGDTPALAGFEGSLYLAWTDTDDVINTIELDTTDNGAQFSDTHFVSATADGGPALGVMNSQLYIAFQGETDNSEGGNLYISPIVFDGDGKPVVAKIDGLAITSDGPPALGQFLDKPFISWTDDDDGNVHVMQLHPESGNDTSP